MTIPIGYNLVWCDEFDGTSINWNKWTQRVGPSSNIKVANGKLQLWANPIGTTQSAGSAFITVKDIPSFKYGYFECSAQNSNVQGITSAFWLLGLGNDNTEIDIYERPGNYGNFQNRIICSLVAACSGICSNFSGTGPAPATGADRFDQVASGFHKYALLWTSTQMRFYLDDVEIWNADSKASSYNIPLELKLDICSAACSFQGQTEPNGSGSTYSEFEYVRVYQQGGTPITCGSGNGPCGQPTCYKCSDTTCVQDDATGTFTSCTPNPCIKGYNCSDCNTSVFGGTYTSTPTCQTSCVTGYNCKNCNMQVPGGIYTTPTICQTACDTGYWLDRSTCLSPTFCISNKYIISGIGIITLILLVKKKH